MPESGTWRVRRVFYGLTVGSALRSSGTAARRVDSDGSCWGGCSDKNKKKNHEIYLKRKIFRWLLFKLHVSDWTGRVLTASPAPSARRRLLAPRRWSGSPSGDWKEKREINKEEIKSSNDGLNVSNTVRLHVVGIVMNLTCFIGPAHQTDLQMWHCDDVKSPFFVLHCPSLICCCFVVFFLFSGAK